uniref:RNA helicase n=1 Tax=Anthurium amnicola TaxID=1678845 RepID=A0A1D1Z9M4_9ARAE
MVCEFVFLQVQRAGFSFPTPIQAQSWPIALQNRDVVAIAKTGSGKTLGYLLPGFIHLKKRDNNSRNSPTVLVLAPTRELATQIQEEAVKFGRSSRISCACLYGGAPKGPQLRDLDRGADVVVATPGRLNDFLEMKKLSLRQVSYLVLDEADRMLDMGFEPQIRKIVKEIPTRRQTLMFTATWPKEVRKIAADLLVHPIQVNIGNTDELVANSAITQHVEMMTPMEKQRRLEQILRSQEPGSKVIVFCSTKRMCDQLARTLTRSFGAAAIHGDKSQSERDFVLSQFRTGRSPILVATDVAARGLDIKDIRVVINYDFPTGVEDYVHRIGRTGRAGATGVSYTFFCDQDAKYAKDLIKVLEGANQRVPSELRSMVSRGGYGKARSRWGSSSGGRDAGRSRGGGRSDSDYGGRGEWGSSGGRSDSAREGRGHSDREPPRDRHDRGHYGSHDDDERGRYDSKGIMGNHDQRTGDRGVDRSRSHSRSPLAGNGGLNDNRSPNKVHHDGDGSRSRSRSRSGTNANNGRSRSRSRSHSFNRYDGVESGRGWSPMAKQNSPASQRTGPAHSAPLQHQQQTQRQPQSSPPNNGDRMQLRRSPSRYDGHEMQPQRSPSPYNGGMQHQRSPSQPWGSPSQHDGDILREAPSDHPSNLHEDKSRLPEKFMDNVTPASPAMLSQYCGDANGEVPRDSPVRSLAPPYRSGEEEEEGVIPADEDGMIPTEAVRNSPRD